MEVLTRKIVGKPPLRYIYNEYHSHTLIYSFAKFAMVKNLFQEQITDIIDIIQ
jgi:hypothetical protein